MSRNRLNLIVAASKNSGIGNEGQLPWRLKGDMAFFKRVTLATKDPEKKNAVIMGRKTWDSIPTKFRPLAGRVNVILSRSLSSPPEGAILATGLDDALEKLEIKAVDEIENVFVIGGSSVYEAAFNHPNCHRIYITDVLQDFECDTFLPKFDGEQYQTIYVEGIPSEEQNDNGIKYRFRVLEKIVTVSVVCAMCSNRGIAYEQSLPWPYIEKDYKHYTGLIEEIEELPNVCIYGRGSWQNACDDERASRRHRNVILSKDYKMSDAGENVWFVAPSLAEALVKLNERRDVIGRVWIMGGERLFEEAIEHPACRHLYVTRIEREYPVDAFMPRFEDRFNLIHERCVPAERGFPSMKFEIWERISPEA